MMEDRKAPPIVLPPTELTIDEKLDRILAEAAKYTMHARDAIHRTSLVEFVPMVVLKLILDKYRETR